ncbi:MAG: S41 family peptidase [Erysipelotrichaceae bacterium]|nr:S41 family peptidase [Erysipelotrichaceae bacterium]MDY3934106.1 S41 family peptidase [Bacilli bacterium]
MIKDNNRIQESKRIIKEEKKKIKREKKILRKKKLNKFKKTKIGKFIYTLSDDRNSYSFSELFIITIISLLVGAFSCFSIITIMSGGRNYLKLSKELSKFYDSYDILVENYNGNVDKKELVDAAINGMVSSVGDQYTSYVDTEGTNSFNQLVDGKYNGIGCLIQETEDKKIKVMQVYENTSAYKAGIKVGDIIKKVDDKDSSIGSTELANYIKSSKNKSYSVTVLRDDKEIKFTLSKNEVEIPVVTSKIFDKGDKKIGYISISIFSSVSAKQFKSNLEKIEKEGIDSLIIDVRDNNGGYLSSVTDITSYLLPRGKIIYQVQKSNSKIKATKDKTIAKREYPIAVLVNENSASASEILAGAIKESYNGYVVGMKTYGKGTVQQVSELSDGSMIKYTIENWLTPNGNWINEKGIDPTDEVELSDDYYKNPNEENDNQLQKALSLLS